MRRSLLPKVPILPRPSIFIGRPASHTKSLFNNIDRRGRNEVENQYENSTLSFGPDR